VYDDYRRVFGEDPGRITAIGINTDADATGEKARAYYGDIAFLPERFWGQEQGAVARTPASEPQSSPCAGQTN